MKSDIIDIVMKKHHATDRAILVSDDGERENAVWLPLSLIEVEAHPDGFVTVTLPQSLAEEKGLV